MLLAWKYRSTRPVDCIIDILPACKDTIYHPAGVIADAFSGRGAN
jgi:hypothetical protein